MFLVKHFVGLLSGLLGTALGFCPVSCAFCQDQTKPGLERTQCSFPDQKDVTVEYTGMRRSGRKVFSEAVPYGKVWKLGPTHSPIFVTSTTLVMEGKEVPAGRYHLSAIPSTSSKWTLLLSTKEINVSGEADKAIRIDLLIRQLHSPVDTLTISFDQPRGGCVLNIRWDETEASALVAEKK